MAKVRRTETSQAGEFEWSTIAALVGYAAHRALAVRAAQDDGKSDPSWRIGRIEQSPHGFQACSGRWAEPTVGANATEAFGQDVLEEGNSELRERRADRKSG